MGTLSFRRSLWLDGARFPEVDVGEDVGFLNAVIQGCACSNILPGGGMVYMRHLGGHNTWSWRNESVGMDARGRRMRRVDRPGFLPSETDSKCIRAEASLVRRVEEARAVRTYGGSRRNLRLLAWRDFKASFSTLPARCTDAASALGECPVEEKKEELRRMLVDGAGPPPTAAAPPPTASPPPIPLAVDSVEPRHDSPGPTPLPSILHHNDVSWGFDCKVQAGEHCPQASRTIQAGQAVTWISVGSHNVVSGANRIADGRFRSEWLSNGDTFSHTFDEPGEYDYFCEPHANMNARITVLGDSPAALCKPVCATNSRTWKNKCAWLNGACIGCSECLTSAATLSSSPSPPSPPPAPLLDLDAVEDAVVASLSRSLEEGGVSITLRQTTMEDLGGRSARATIVQDGAVAPTAEQICGAALKPLFLEVLADELGMAVNFAAKPAVTIVIEEEAPRVAAEIPPF